MKELTLAEINAVLLRTQEAFEGFINICDTFIQHHNVSGDIVVAILSPHITAMKTATMSLNDKLDREELWERKYD